MISESKLKEICDRYGIDLKKLTASNPNIFEKGNYKDICQVLDYLRDELKIMPKNIEKCPSILYRNVSNIRGNHEFLENKNIEMKEVESCLHVLSAEPKQLANTFEYVKENYGIKSIERITSILSVDISVIKSVEDLNIKFNNKNGNLSVAVAIGFGTTTVEKIQKIIQSEEFKEYSELFTSQTLVNANLEDIQKIIQSEEFKEHPELFTSQTLAFAKPEDIQKIMQSDEFKSHPELFTSQTLAHAKPEDIQKIIQSEEFKEHSELFTSTTLAHAKPEEIQKIIQSEEFKKYPKLFKVSTLAHAKIEDIQKLLKLDYWKDERYKKLLTASVVANSKSMLDKMPKLIKLAENFQIDKYLNTNFMSKSLSQNYALIKYLQDSNQPLIVNNKLNAIFAYQPCVLLKKYKIDIKELMKKYPLEKYDLEKKSGFEDCIKDDKTKKSDVKKLKGEILKLNDKENIEI